MQSDFFLLSACYLSRGWCPCCMRVLQSVWTDKRLFLQSHPQTARNVHECSRADIRLWVHELCMSPSTKPSSAAPSLAVLLHNFLCAPGSKTHMSPTHHQVTTNSRVCAHLIPLFYLATCWVFRYPQNCSRSWFLMAQMGKLRHALLTFSQGKVYTYFSSLFCSNFLYVRKDTNSSTQIREWRKSSATSVLMFPC